MRKRLAWLTVFIGGALSVVVGLSFADSSTAWTSSANPTIQKVGDLPDNTLPTVNNIDCDPITTRMAYSRIMQNACVMQTPLGLAGDNGVIFTGSSELVPVTVPPPFSGLRPFPNQSMMYTYSSASGVGVYMGMYRTIRDKMKPFPDLINGGYQYTLTSGPDFVLKNLAGKSQPVNPQALAFSQNGDWMVVDFPFQGLVRVNLATFDVMPFGPSMNNGNDYAAHTAQLTISNDGRYVAIKPDSGSVFIVYDVGSCTKAVLPYDQTQGQCQSRNYWPDFSAKLPNLRLLLLPRFTSTMQLQVTAQYDNIGSTYKVAQYSLTAPGENPMGIEYLGVGDSFASGQGAFNYIAGTDTASNTCHLSSLSYPFLISAALFNSGHSVACSGGETTDITGAAQQYEGQNTPHRTELKLDKDGVMASILNNYSPGYLLQSDFVDKYNPQLITLSIGGNDIGFQDIITKCVSPTVFGSTCYPTKEDQQELINAILDVQGKLQSTYHKLKASGRKVYVIGYPQIVVSGGNCASNVHLNEAEIKLFSDLTNLLNATIREAATREGVQYVDVSNAFAGHRMCETKSSNVAVNGLTAGTDTGSGRIKVIGAESYHPNVLGHELLKQAILGQTNSFKTYLPTVSSPVTPALPYASAPATGRTINLVIPDRGLAPDEIPPLSTLQLHFDGATMQLRSSSSFTVKFDDTTLANASSDATGNLDSTVAIPSTSCGPHTVHIYGQNIIGQPIDIYKQVYVTADVGCSNTQGGCGVTPISGVDSDKDGIDDACDPVISDPPPNTSQVVYLTGSSIHVVQASVAEPSVTVATNNVSLYTPSQQPSALQHSKRHFIDIAITIILGITVVSTYLRLNKYTIPH